VLLELTKSAVIVAAIYNLLRMMVYLVGADLYTMKRARSKDRVLIYQPAVSVVAPMHNEAPVVQRTLASLLAVDYEPLQIIVADDGSTDSTLARIYAFKAIHDPENRIEVFEQANGGKADVLNNAIGARATGELVMCLDGDSTIAPDAVAKSVTYFRDPRVVATSSNVNIFPDGTLLGFIQRFEYLVNHHMKKAQTAFNIEYIIGGVGSMYRRSTLDDVGLYDTNTMTEDIDLTMKIIARKGNRQSRVVFAAESLVYTEAVPSLRSLIKQRTRWKYGRMQTFYKNWRLFFSMDRKHSLGLSWFMLPVALLQEAAGLLEPLALAFVIAVGVLYRSPATILSAVVLIAVFSALNIFGNAHLGLRDKLQMTAAAPLMYLGFYVITMVEYVALLHLILKLHRLPASVSREGVTWVSPERSGRSMGGRHRATEQA
jgi:cellulose synthase/poly-beta-1,6-N-acetylglucosamine synthase-like glycosyltransferase